MKPSGIGGQAVIEGVMMKNKTKYAIAVRKPDHEIIVENREYDSIKDKFTFLKFPVLRGIIAFIESMVIGMKTLTFSASFFEEEEEKKTSKFEEKLNSMFKGKAESIIMALVVIFSICMAVGIFVLIPFFACELLKNRIESQAVRGLIEGIIRVVIFIAYVKAITLMDDIKRVFMYHGAEHKTINCVENGLELTVSNVKGQSKEHKRCGTSFLLVVMFFSIIFFVFINADNMWLRMIYRLVLVPVVAGVAYEFLMFAGRSESTIMNILSKPGLWLQGLTTREPDDDMIEVAIASVNAVFDWKAFQQDTEKEEMNEAAVSETQTAASVMDEEFQAVDVDSEEDDDILKALDRYFDDGDGEKK